MGRWKARRSFRCLGEVGAGRWCGGSATVRLVLDVGVEARRLGQSHEGPFQLEVGVFGWMYIIGFDVVVG